MEHPSVDTADGKRPRSPSSSATPSQAPAAKVAKPNPPTTTTTNATSTTANPSSMSINYLARHSQTDLPLIDATNSTFSTLLTLLGNYTTILDRHESLASNLGARPLGPILIKRFERCFDAPPLVIASHHKGAGSGGSTLAEDLTPRSGSVSWMDVIEFARGHPSQFSLSSFSEGRRVCQFYYPTKQVRVQISEEDFLFINSGRCQELIPPLPIWEDEEKEVATCEVLEERLKEVTQLADMVAARTRQVGHRLKGRRQAVAGRRKEGGGGTPAKVPGGGGFVAVNGVAGGAEGGSGSGGGISVTSSAAIRGELVKHFESLPHNQQHNQQQQQARPSSKQHPTHPTIEAAAPQPKALEAALATHSTNNNNAHHPITISSDNRPDIGGAHSSTSSLSPVPTDLNMDHQTYSHSHPATAPAATAAGASANHQHRPSITSNSGNQAGSTPLKHNFSRPLPPALESSQPFRPLCQAHMDSLPRGHRVIPPCDRCRRLRMDCVKNLTSCAGCTRKHARCHWRDVSRDEVGALDEAMSGGQAMNGEIVGMGGFGGVRGYGGGMGGGMSGYGGGGRQGMGGDDGMVGAYLAGLQGNGGMGSYGGGMDGDGFLRSMGGMYEGNGHGHIGDGLSEDDDEDDEESDPLGDLDKIGEQEEVLKGLVEDEEGLRNARELSRAAQFSGSAYDDADALQNDTVSTANAASGNTGSAQQTNGTAPTPTTQTTDTAMSGPRGVTFPYVNHEAVGTSFPAGYPTNKNISFPATSMADPTKTASNPTATAYNHDSAVFQTSEPHVHQHLDHVPSNSNLEGEAYIAPLGESEGEDGDEGMGGVDEEVEKAEGADGEGDFGGMAGRVERASMGFSAVNR